MKRLLFAAALLAGTTLGPSAADARPRCPDAVCDMCYQSDLVRFCL